MPRTRPCAGVFPGKVCNDIGVADVSRCDARGIPGSESVASRFLGVVTGVPARSRRGSAAWRRLCISRSLPRSWFWCGRATRRSRGWSTVSLGVFSAFAHGTSSWVGELITGTAVAVVGVIAVRIVLAGRKQAREHARVRDFHRDVLSIVARRDNSESDVLWLDHPLPMAYSVAGKPGFVVATQGLSSALSGGERDAVLAHERAHLSGGHHRIVGA